MNLRGFLIIMKFLERSLEDFLWYSSNDVLSDIGLVPDKLQNEFNVKKIRQLHIGNYGIADLIYVKRYYNPSFAHDTRMCIEFNVVELKKDEINLKTFSQALRYSEGIKEYLKFRGKFTGFGNYAEFKLTLIGKEINLTNEFLNILKNCSHEVDIYTYSTDGDVLSFNKFHWEDFSLSSKGFR